MNGFTSIAPLHSGCCASSTNTRAPTSTMNVSQNVSVGRVMIDSGRLLADHNVNGRQPGITGAAIWPRNIRPLPAQRNILYDSERIRQHHAIDNVGVGWS